MGENQEKLRSGEFIMSKFDTVIFDLDGTLINTLDDLANSANYMLKHYGYPQFSVDDYKYKVGNGIRKLVERSLPENHRTPSEIDEAFNIFMSHYNEHSLDNTKPYDGIDRLLLDLRQMGIKIGVVTNKAHEAAVKILDKLLPGRFDVIYGQHEGVPTKPDPTSTLTVMSKLGTTPEHCIFMGDSSVDVQTACNSGAYAVGVLWGFRTKEELLENGAKTIIETPDELLKLLK